MNEDYLISRAVINFIKDILSAIAWTFFYRNMKEHGGKF